MASFKRKNLKLETKTHVVQFARRNRLFVDFPIVRERPITNGYAIAFKGKPRGGIHPYPSKSRETETRAGTFNLRNRSWNRTQFELYLSLALTSVFAQNQHNFIDSRICDKTRGVQEYDSGPSFQRTGSLAEATRTWVDDDGITRSWYELRFRFVVGRKTKLVSIWISLQFRRYYSAKPGVIEVLKNYLKCLDNFRKYVGTFLEI